MNVYLKKTVALVFSSWVRALIMAVTRLVRRGRERCDDGRRHNKSIEYNIHIHSTTAL